MMTTMPSNCCRLQEEPGRAMMGGWLENHHDTHHQRRQKQKADQSIGVTPLCSIKKKWQKEKGSKKILGFSPGIPSPLRQAKREKSTKTSHERVIPWIMQRRKWSAKPVATRRRHGEWLYGAVRNRVLKMMVVVMMVMLLVSLHRHRDAEVIGLGRHLNGTKSCAARTMQSLALEKRREER
jgi:hypothetical protein